MASEEPRERLAGLITGYFASQLVYVAARLGLADLLAGGPRSAGELAGAVGADPRALYRLLRALAGLGIFAEGEGGRFAPTPMADLLRGDHPDSQRAAALMMGGDFYRAWGGLLETVRTGRPAFEAQHGRSYFAHLAGDPEAARTFDAAMTSLNDRKTRAMLEVYDFGGVATLADVGGGNGAALARILQRYPGMRGVLFDLPGVVEHAGSALAAAGVSERCRVVGGSFLEPGMLPAGADAYLLRHVLHNWDDEHALAILRNLRGVLGPGARLLVVERIVPPGDGPSPAKLMDLTMLVIHGGAERTEEEFRRLFEAAGLRLARIVPTAAEVSVIEAEGA